MATVPRSAEAERHDHLLAELLGQVSAYNPNLDADQIKAAFDYACDHHAGQARKSGESFIHHPWAVAQICAELKLDSATITAALLHDTVEDTEAELEDVRTRFGEDVALLVDGVTKLTRISFASREQAQVENYRKMIVAMAHDLRVVLIKLADRLHNMRTISSLGKQKQVQTARETLEIYAPLAHRLGIHSIKWELEDLAFATLHPRRHAEIGSMVSQTRTDRERFADEAGDDPPPRARGDRYHGGHRRAGQAPVLDLREDGAGGQGVQRDLRPDRDPRAGRLDQGLLRRDRRHPLALEADAGAVQGLRRNAQVQHVPVAAHDGDRDAGKAARDPGAHA